MFRFKNPDDNEDGWTPLRCAALSGNKAISRELITLGVDVNAPFPRDLMDTWHTENAWKGGNIICHVAFYCHTPAGVEILELLHLGGSKLRQNNEDVLNCGKKLRIPFKTTPRGKSYEIIFIVKNHFEFFLVKTSCFFLVKKIIFLDMANPL